MNLLLASKRKCLKGKHVFTAIISHLLSFILRIKVAPDETEEAKNRK